MREEQSLNLTNERKRMRAVEIEGGNGVRKPESSMSREVRFREYPMVQFPGNANRNVAQQNQLGSSELRFEGNLKYSNDKVLGLEFVARLQRRTRGLRRLRKIHGVDLKNRVHDICPRSLLKREIREASQRISQGEKKQAEKVAENGKNVVFEEEKGVNSLARAKRMNFFSAKWFGISNTRNSRTRRKLNTGKRTVLSWMIASKTIKSRERVCYRDQRSKTIALSGDAVGDGILCDCCSLVVSISEFEFHSWRWRQDMFDLVGRVSDPLQNICLAKERGPCLLQCLGETWSKETEFSSKFYNLVHEGKESDDTCRVCGEKENLICCSGCPSTFHQTCLGIPIIPGVDWHCMSCCCKFCGLYCGKIEIAFEGLVPFEISSECLVCERRFHQRCLGTNRGNSGRFKRLPLCGKGCREIYERLQRLLHVKHDIEDGFSWSFIYRADVDPNLSRLEADKVECNAKLGVALSVLSESFVPYIEEGSGTNIIRSIVYSCGSNFPRLDCKRFITAILEKDYEIISVASFRIHGKQLAELPFVATVFGYRKQGMFARLLKIIESTLSDLKVELLIVPAVQQARETWVRSFGFQPLDSRTKSIIKGVNLMKCRGTEMLQKKIPQLI